MNDEEKLFDEAGEALTQEAVEEPSEESKPLDDAEPVFQLALALQKGEPGFDPLFEGYRSAVAKAIQDFESKAQGKLVSAEVLQDLENIKLDPALPKTVAGDLNDPCEMAVYALAVFMDEMVMTSQWSGKDTWETKWLEAEITKKNAVGGTRFFDRLKAIMSCIGHAKASERLRESLRRVLEIYYVCLALGFEGKHRGEEDRRPLSACLRDARQLVDLAPPTLDCRLFESAYKPIRPIEVQRMARGRVWLIAGMVAAGIVVIAYVVFWILLRQDVGAAASDLLRLGQGA